MTAHHDIHVNLEKHSDGFVHAIPRNIPDFIRPGETVQYLSTDGEVTMEFEDPDLSPAHGSFCSPFLDASGNQKKSVSSKDGPIKVSNIGVYLGHCFITLQNGTVIGWGPNSLQSGANHVVK